MSQPRNRSLSICAGTRVHYASLSLAKASVLIGTPREHEHEQCIGRGLILFFTNSVATVTAMDSTW